MYYIGGETMEQQMGGQHPSSEQPTHDGGWLTGLKVMQEVHAGRILIDPFEKESINSNSYNYRLSSVLQRLTNEVIDCRLPDTFETIQIPDEGYILEPGECYLGATQETFGSDIYASLITGRSSVGRKFITNHITAGLIDQGFFGSITLEIVALRRARIYAGMPFGQIFWFTTCGLPRLYTGKYQGQDSPTPSKLGQDFATRITLDSQTERSDTVNAKDVDKKSA
jgi:dCTP deaminase